MVLSKRWRMTRRTHEHYVPQTELPWYVQDKNFNLRLAGLDDINFIIDSWCANQSDAAHFREIDEAIVKVELRARIRRLMTSLARFVVCVPSINHCQEHQLRMSDRELWGYTAFSWDSKTMAPVVHFVYVKQEVRRRHLAHGMLHLAAGVKPGEHFWSTHTSALGRRVLSKYGGTWNPFMLEFLDTLSDGRRL